jgi:uncharacterized protein (DUF2267 family)
MLGSFVTNDDGGRMISEQWDRGSARAEAWFEELRLRAGLEDPAAAERALRAVLESLGEILTPDEASLLSGLLPGELAVVVQAGAGCGLSPGDYDALVDAVEIRENAGIAAAREHVSATFAILGEAAEGDSGAELRRRLPPFLASMLDARTHLGRPPRHVPHGHDEPEPRETLATGRPSSKHPVSEARPEAAHANSVARSDEPHQDTKLSSARGLTQERLGDTLAEGTPGPRRAISGA